MAKVSKVRKSRSGGCLMMLFFGVFAAAGCGTFYFLTWKPLYGIYEASRWEEKDCEVLSSRLVESRGSDGSTYRIDIRYRYEGPWGSYEGDRYNFSVGSSSGYDRKAKIVDAHPPGIEVPCYVDPDDPTRSVINRKPGFYLLWGLFPLPFLLVGFGGLIGVAIASRATPEGIERLAGRSRPQRRRSDPETRTATRAGLVSRTPTQPSDARGPLELEPEVSAKMKVIGTFASQRFGTASSASFCLQESSRAFVVATSTGFSPSS